jgi:hypothetical protein
VLRRIYGPKREDEGRSDWRALHSEQLHGLLWSPNITRVMKSRRIGWAGHVARMGEEQMHTGFERGYLKARSHFIDLWVDGRIILKWIL